ncbi:MAG: phosphopantetheine-binding protein [Desulfobacteraceae bacterium]|jgi:acyl carrier protein
MNIEKSKMFSSVSETLVDILDVAPEEITPDAYLIRDLGVESIDLMELAVSLNQQFNLEVDEELIFLKSLRSVVEKARERNADVSAAVAKEFFFLSSQRIAEILEDLANGPVLKVKDLIQYISTVTQSKGKLC